MQIVESTHVPPATAVWMARQSRRSAALAMVGFLLTTLVLPIGLASTARLPWGIAAWWGSIGVVMTTLAAGALADCCRRENWTVALVDDELWVNLRSHRNRHFRTAPTVAQLPLQQILGVELGQSKRQRPGSDGDVTWRETWLDLNVPDDWLADLEHAVHEERQRRSERCYLGGITVRTRANHVPVMVTRGEQHERRLRIFWRSRLDHVAPAREQLIGLLPARFQTHVTEQHILPGCQADCALDKMTSSQLDEMIQRMIDTGDTIGAIGTLIRERGYSTDQAKQFVDRLAAEPAGFK